MQSVYTVISILFFYKYIISKIISIGVKNRKKIQIIIVSSDDFT